MSNGRLDGKVALVTGGASGIGRATVLSLAEHGAHVAVVDRDGPGSLQVAALAGNLGITSRSFAVDLADSQAIEPLVQSVLKSFGQIDILVNCAGVTGGRSNSIDFSDEVLDLVLSVNLRAPMLLTRAVGRHMIDRGEGGRIVNLSSSAAFRATHAPAVYAATKAGIGGLTRTSAGDLGQHDINVNAVAPGVTKTPMIGASDEEALQRTSKGPLANLLGRPAEPEDVANVIVFLCLPESRQITGQVINTSAGLVV